MKGKIVFSLVSGLILAFGVSAFAQDYPTKMITLMVAYPPGGSTDVGARIVAAIAEKQIGQPIVVVNKAGAGGQAEARRLLYWHDQPAASSHDCPRPGAQGRLQG